MFIRDWIKISKFNNEDLVDLHIWQSEITKYLGSLSSAQEYKGLEEP